MIQDIVAILKNPPFNEAMTLFSLEEKKNMNNNMTALFKSSFWTFPDKYYLNKFTAPINNSQEYSGDDDIVESFDVLQVGSPCVLQAESFH